MRGMCRTCMKEKFWFIDNVLIEKIKFRAHISGIDGIYILSGNIS